MPRRHHDRLDLSDFVLHFVHGLKQEAIPSVYGHSMNLILDLEMLQAYNELARALFDEDAYDAAVERSMKGIATDDDDKLFAMREQAEEECISSPARKYFYAFADFDENDPLQHGATAFDVFKRIIQTGHIRAGWSFRKGEPTIYGYRAACCFTEMPLYALLHYAKSRSYDGLVSPYAIALKRDEFFAAGGRPVIYGLSTEHAEAPEREFSVWPRLLLPEVGIGLREQFRYVYTNLSSYTQKDWTHEREWRWPYNKNPVPGLNLWLEEDELHFSQITLIVASKTEADELLNLLKAQYDSESFNEGDWHFSKSALERTDVISVEEIKWIIGTDSLENFRLDDLPSRSLRSFQQPDPDLGIMAKLPSVIAEARNGALTAAQNHIQSRDDWGFGFAEVKCLSGQSPFLSSLIKLSKTTEGLHITPLGADGYQIYGLIPSEVGPQLSERKAAAEGAMRVLQKHFPEVEFGIWWKWD